MVDGTVSQTVVTNASEAIETVAWKLSKCIYAYDVALQQGFGLHAKAWKASGEHGPQVIEMQTRSGAGLAITGRMSEGTSSEGAMSSFILSVFTTPLGLAQMMPALVGLPNASACASNRAVIHIPSISTLDDSLALSPSLFSLNSILPIVPEQLSIILSSNAQEVVDLASVAYSVTTSHVAHVFDHFASARELTKLTPARPHDYDVSKHSVSVQKALNKAGYALFDYHGSRSASDIFVVVNGALAGTLKELVKNSETVAVIVVRLLRPWESAKFAAILPPSAKKIHVLDDVASSFVEGALYQDVLSTVLDFIEAPPVIRSIRVTPSELHLYISSPDELRKALSIPPLSTIHTAVDSEGSVQSKNVVFWGTSGTSTSSLPEQITRTFLGTKSIQARLLTNSDAFAKPGGIILSRLLLAASALASDAPIDYTMPLSGQKQHGANFTAVLDASLLKTHDILQTASPGSPVLVYTPWTPDEVFANLHPSTAALIVERDLQLYSFDPKVGEDDVHAAIAHIAFLRLYVGGGASVDILERVSRAAIGDDVAGTPTGALVRTVWKGLKSVILPLPVETNSLKLKKKTIIPPLQQFEFNATSFAGFAELVAGSERNGPVSGAWHEAAKHLLFPEAFSVSPSTTSDPPTIEALRPELPIRTYLVTCSVNQRLTPKAYDRNVFHMEFDTTGTGLTYKLGEALGIHGWNDDGDVLEFCKWYGVDPNAIISVPVPTTQGGFGNPRERKKVTRTVFQAVQQQIDIFGRPPKSFFAALATYATNRREMMALRFIAAPEGAATLKKLGEKDTVNYADVLALYPSARPSIEELAVIVEEIKERHYSIASAQSVVGNRVDLLVVTVDWVTPSGSPKYGQCTRYLANLKVGSKVTVSIKPSVMKLPPSDLQPIIMAGLGTGAAPFRAFIQHRNLLKSQGTPVGPMIYYFGSRHRSQEYLYGEEIEAYIKDGVITHAGLAFSRDTGSKVYIQHKMRHDAQYLAGLIAGDDGKPENTGVFYLCGPTWPVPDVHEALVNALAKYAGKSIVAASDFIEQLKEDERYVLEVY